jgi:hypothetical protein
MTLGIFPFSLYKMAVALLNDIADAFLNLIIADINPHAGTGSRHGPPVAGID